MKTIEKKLDGLTTEIKTLSETVNGLTQSMNRGFKEAKVEIEDLAAMTVREFGVLRSEMKTGFNETKTDLEDLAAMTGREFLELRNEMGMGKKVKVLRA